MAYLTIQVPHQPTERTMLIGRTVMGRAIGSDVWFDDPRLSRLHCVIELDSNRWVLKDQGSTNGTFVNSKRVDQIFLNEGDMIEIGQARIEFQEGCFVEARPADPIDAALAPPGPFFSAGSLSHATVVGEPIHRRPLPVPQPHIIHPQPRTEMPAVPLPFTRPRARPIVHGEPTPDAARSSRWMETLMSQLLGD